MAKLIDLLHNADAIEVDRVLCSNFYLESEETDPEDIALDVSYEEDGNTYEHYITFEEIDNAKLNKDGSWSLMANNGEWDDGCTIKPYKLNELK